MAKLTVYDPPMCCSTGVCGPAVDPRLVRVAADLDWLKRQGVDVERFNLAQQPQAFATNPTITTALREHGNDCLPLILVDGEIVSRGTYPDRSGLASLAGLGAVVQVQSAQSGNTSCCTGPAAVTTGGGPDR